MRFALTALLLALSACATSGGDAPRAEFDPRAVGPDSPTNPNQDPRVYTRIGPVRDNRPTGSAKPCGGGCNPGEYCDQSSGMDRCLKDVIPAASTPGK